MQVLGVIMLHRLDGGALRVVIWGDCLAGAAWLVWVWRWYKDGGLLCSIYLVYFWHHCGILRGRKELQMRHGGVAGRWRELQKRGMAQEGNRNGLVDDLGDRGS